METKFIASFDTISIQKNRGWRGLAEAIIRGEDNKEIISMVFSFSPKVWKDMLNGQMVFQDQKYYYIVDFEDLDKLPRKDQQRSVLIKNFHTKITHVIQYTKENWKTSSSVKDYSLIDNFVCNKNNHTTSDWNYIGVRVIPEI